MLHELIIILREIIIFVKLKREYYNRTKETFKRPAITACRLLLLLQLNALYLNSVQCAVQI